MFSWVSCRRQQHGVRFENGEDEEGSQTEEELTEQHSEFKDFEEEGEDNQIMEELNESSAVEEGEN